MKIRNKFITIVLPILIGGIVLSGITATTVARRAVTRVTVRFLNFKTDQLYNYIDSQWRILVENDMSSRQDMILAAQAGVETYARSLLLSESELVFALDENNEMAMATSPFSLSEEEKNELLQVIAGDRFLSSVEINGENRVVSRFNFDPFGWSVYTTELNAAFYADVSKIITQTLILTSVVCVLAIGLLLLFVGILTKPLIHAGKTMQSIISSTDLSSRVPVVFRDEIGEMSQTFNVMIGELEKAYTRIKNYAFQAVVAQKKENKIRNIFQKYVPQELIDKFFASPESMLIGENRTLSIIFSDIRSFTSISERLTPDALVSSLNRYFSVMVDIIMNRGGIIDKYIGDAIMAIFGAPVSHEDDALSSVLAGLEMVNGLETFNKEQRKLGEPEFKIGVGINYGIVTVGNIGTDRKMDYTVIGDMVNVASRLEGLTKLYHQPIIISEMLWEEVKETIPSRLVDTVAVKGRSEGIRIYTPMNDLSPEQEKALNIHNKAMELYYQRNFNEASTHFQEVSALLGDDYLAEMMKERCARYSVDSPPDNWDGVEIMETK